MRTLELNCSEVLVSIVIPVFNSEKYLRECLDSIISESYEKLQIICVDDGSTDCSGNILDEYSRIDSRIEVIHQDNQFAGIARNNGYDRVRGDYVLFLDSDDFFEDNHISRMLSKAIETKADVVICGARKYDNKKREYGTLKLSLDLRLINSALEFKPYEVKENLFQLTAGWAWDKMYKTRFITENKLSFQDTKVANDARMVYTAFALASLVAVVPEELVIHRTNVEGSLEYNRNLNWKCGIEMLRALKYELESRRLFDTYKASYVRYTRNYLVGLLNSIKLYECYCDLFNCISGGLTDELGLLDHIGATPQDHNSFNEISRIIKMDCSEYAFYRWQSSSVISNQNKCNIPQGWILFEERIPENSRVVLYGYGNVGRDFASQIRRSGRLQIVAIVDERFGKTDGNIINDIKLVSRDLIDYIIIAMVDACEANGIKSKLIDIGFPEEAIYIQE